MTRYESCAITLSIIAVLIPIFQWAWRKWIVKPVLDFLPTGRAYLLINRSGSYIKIEGVFEALRKSVSIKNIALKIVRNKDDAVLNLNWSMFMSPVNQRIVGAMTSATEIAHPFRVEADSVACTFVEYVDFYESAGKTLRPCFDDLFIECRNFIPESNDFPEACKAFRKSSVYQKAEQAIQKEFFWIMTVKHGNQEKQFYFEFEVTKEMLDDLQWNIQETLVSCLKDIYGLPYNMRLVQVALKTL